MFKRFKARKKFIYDIMKHSWRFERLTEEQKEKVVDYLTYCELHGNYEERIIQLKHIYNYLLSLFKVVSYDK